MSRVVHFREKGSDHDLPLHLLRLSNAGAGKW